MPSLNTKPMIVVALSLALLAGAGTWIMAGRDGGGDRMPATTPARSVDVTTAPAHPDEFVEFRHQEAAFALSYPKTWVTAAAPDPQVVLVAAEQEPAKNQGGSILVRVTPLDTPVGKGQLGEARKVTDAIVSSSDGVALKAEPTETEQGGLPGL